MFDALIEEIVAPAPLKCDAVTILPAVNAPLASRSHYSRSTVCIGLAVVRALDIVPASNVRSINSSVQAYSVT
jgi:hypothetical protein